MNPKFNKNLLMLGIGRTAELQKEGRSRTLKRNLIKKYKRYFTNAEIKELYKMSAEEINSEIDKKVGKFK